MDPLNKVPSKRATSRVKKGPLSGVSLTLPRILAFRYWVSGCVRGTVSLGLGFGV